MRQYLAMVGDRIIDIVKGERAPAYPSTNDGEAVQVVQVDAALDYKIGDRYDAEHLAPAAAADPTAEEKILANTDYLVMMSEV